MLSVQQYSDRQLSAQTGIWTDAVYELRETIGTVRSDSALGASIREDKNVMMQRRLMEQRRLKRVA